MFVAIFVGRGWALFCQKRVNFDTNLQKTQDLVGVALFECGFNAQIVFFASFWPSWSALEKRKL